MITSGINGESFNKPGIKKEFEASEFTNDNDYFLYNDFDFFIVWLFIEYGKKGITSIPFGNIYNFGLEGLIIKNDGIYDYDSFEEYILRCINDSFHDDFNLDFFNVIDYTIETKNIYQKIILSSFRNINEAIKDQSIEISDIASYYDEVLESLFNLQFEHNFKRSYLNTQFKVQKGFPGCIELLREIPENIIINVEFNNKKIYELEKNTEIWLYEGNIEGDYPIDKQQFIEDIKSFLLIKDIVRITYNVIGTKKYDFFKTLKHLEIHGKLKVLDLTDFEKGYWEVQILDKEILEYFPLKNYETVSKNGLGFKDILLSYKEKTIQLKGYELKLCEYLFKNNKGGKYEWNKIEVYIYGTEQQGGNGLKSLLEKLKKKIQNLGYKEKVITYSVGDYVYLDFKEPEKN